MSLLPSALQTVCHRGTGSTLFKLSCSQVLDLRYSGLIWKLNYNPGFAGEECSLAVLWCGQGDAGLFLSIKASIKDLSFASSKPGETGFRLEGSRCDEDVAFFRSSMCTWKDKRWFRCVTLLWTWGHLSGGTGVTCVLVGVGWEEGCREPSLYWEVIFSVSLALRHFSRMCGHLRHHQTDNFWQLTWPSSTKSSPTCGSQC